MTTKERLQTIKPEAAYESLINFVVKAQQTPEAPTYEALRDSINPDVASALGSMILYAGRPSEYPDSLNLAVLEVKAGRSVMQGVVQGIDEEPSSIHLSEFKRGLFGFKHTRELIVGIDGLREHTDSVATPKEFWIPHHNSSPRIHSLFLDTAAELTRKLIAGRPIHS